MNLSLISSYSIFFLGFLANRVVSYEFFSVIIFTFPLDSSHLPPYKCFLKMDKQEKEEIKKELTQPLVLLATVLNCLGLLLFFSGLIISTTKLQYIGAFMIIIGWILGCIITWKKAFKEV